jgi:hypothetical protein
MKEIHCESAAHAAHAAALLNVAMAHRKSPLRSYEDYF